MYDRRHVLRLGGAALIAGLAGCTGDGGGSDGGDGGGSDGATQEITVGPGGELVFDPAEVTVAAGTTVEWVWDSSNHSVTPESQPDGADWGGTGTDTFDKGHTHSHEFTVEGTYDYFCNPHRGQGMVGTLTVGSGGGGGGSTETTTGGGGGGGGAY